jgi:hypothetical protein
MTAFNVETWSKNHPYSSNQRPAAGMVLSHIIDFSQKLAAAATSAGGVAADTVKVLAIPAGTFVCGVRLTVQTVQGAVCTVNIGDSATAAGYFSAADLNALTDAFSFNATTTPTYGVGKFYAAADDLIVTLGHTTDVAKIKLEVLVFDVETGR